MASLFHICPKTKLRTSAEVEADAATLQKLWSSGLKINCPHCGEVHETSVRELYVDDTLATYMTAPSGRSSLLSARNND